LSDRISGQWPIWIDAGYRFNPNWYLGGYAQYGLGFVNDNQLAVCRNANVDCSASDTRLGVMGRYHFVPEWQFSPWVGLGFGYEWASLSIHESVLSSTTDTSWSGFEFANLQVGADYRIASRFLIGPFLSLSFGEYRNISTTLSRGSSSSTTDQSLAKESIHEWILIGVWAAFKP
jgi:outer membrane protein W